MTAPRHIGHAGAGSFDPLRLLQRLLALDPAPARFLLAFSGGMDSTVLLHALARHRSDLPAPLAAVHVNHGLNPDSQQWAMHCQRQCERCAVPLVQCTVDAQAMKGESPEAVARDARYTAIAELMMPGDCLLTAHHLDDQAETLLLQLMRGAGVDGLAAMPVSAEWAGGRHLRPLLDYSRDALRHWALQQTLNWIDDPSNAEMLADRNFLRHQVMPLLQTRWPGARSVMAQSAAHCAEVAALLREQADLDLITVISEDGQQLGLGALRELPDTRKRGVVRRWLRQRRVPPIPRRRLLELIRQIGTARADAAVAVAWAGWEIRRFRQSLWLLAPIDPPASGFRVEWGGAELALGCGLGRVTRRRAAGGLSREAWASGRVEIGFREPGLRCRPVGRDGSRSFKKIAQESGLPPWLRPLIPVVFIDGKVAAIAGCCVCEPFAARPGEEGWFVDWSPDPLDRRLPADLG